MNDFSEAVETTKDKALHCEGWEPCFCKSDNPHTLCEMGSTAGKALWATVNCH